jgi:hypothetical protein
MSTSCVRRAAAAIGLLLVSSALSASGQTQTFVSFAALGQASSDLDDGGDFSATAVLLRAGMSRRYASGRSAGISFSYDAIDYDFSGGTSYPGAPWGTVQRIGFSAPMGLPGSNGWQYGLSPSVEWSRENGADWGDSLIYGAVVSATRVLDPDRRIGVGLGAFSQLEETRVFPLVLVDWRLSERWRLVNPLPSGPVGPAGLELDYGFDSGWNLGLGLAYRSIRFRLDEDGPVPGGVGEENGVPVFLRGSTRIGERASFMVYAGAMVSGELELEDADGNGIDKQSFDPSPLLGLSLSGRF